MEDKPVSRPLTTADIAKAYEAHARTACGIFNDCGEAHPQVIFLCVDEEPGSLKAAIGLDEQFVHAAHLNNENLAALMELLDLTMRGEGALAKWLAEQGMVPDMAVHISEGYFTMVCDGVKAEPTEVVNVVVRTRGGELHGGYSPVTVDGEGKRRAEFKPFDPKLRALRGSDVPDDEDKVH